MGGANPVPIEPDLFHRAIATVVVLLAAVSRAEGVEDRAEIVNTALDVVMQLSRAADEHPAGSALVPVDRAGWEGASGPSDAVNGPDYGQGGAGGLLCGMFRGGCWEPREVGWCGRPCVHPWQPHTRWNSTAASVEFQPCECAECLDHIEWMHLWGGSIAAQTGLA